MFINDLVIEMLKWKKMFEKNHKFLYYLYVRI